MGIYEIDDSVDFSRLQPQRSTLLCTIEPDIERFRGHFSAKIFMVLLHPGGHTYNSWKIRWPVSSEEFLVMQHTFPGDYNCLADVDFSSDT